MSVFFSIVVPVYNRPDEIKELLQSLTNQTYKDFEVLIVEDGSSLKCDAICDEFKEKLDIKYFFKPNSGRSETRNYGLERANGEFFVIFDSDVILPPHYFETVKKNIEKDAIECYGGPDSADDSFNAVQKAINYSMTSIFTTGGIRGGTKKVDKFSPRSFNMGFSKEVFKTVGGYKNIIGEDIDLSIRIKNAGFKIKLIRDAYVFHKRRVSFKKFFKQVYTFGKARVLLSKMHPKSLKIVHLFPACFVLGTFLLLILAIIFNSFYFVLPLLLFVLVVFVESLIKNKNFKVAGLSILASFYQLFGYGLGFLDEMFTGSASKKTQENLYK
ncbi:MAG: glycosyltransferase [Bacteroidales bacterium]|nr:glycosyltransferase [Bacteroidales bacterium]